MKKHSTSFGSYLEAFVYPLLLLSAMWIMFWAEQVSGFDLVRLGVRPQQLDSWPGIFLMPLIHSPNDIAHIVNNSLPTFVLLAALIFYYRSIAWKVFLISWFGTGIGVWLFAADNYAWHIGMSGVDYALFGFIFLSGFFRKYKPLQAISLFVVFVYGSMFWGIFPQKENVSWEGHFSGMFIGMTLAILYRKQGPQSPKYQYEIEKELGIEPPDLEGMWIARQEELERQQREREEAQRQSVEIIYHLKRTAQLPAPQQTDIEQPPSDSEPK